MCIHIYIYIYICIHIVQMKRGKSLSGRLEAVRVGEVRREPAALARQLPKSFMSLLL